MYQILPKTITKHCQRHNGPEGWVHLAKITSWGLITSSNTNLDQISSSESRSSINFKISTKHQPLDLTTTWKSWPDPASESRPNSNFMTSTKHQQQHTDQNSALKSIQFFFSNVDNLFAALCSCWQHSQASRNLEKLFKALRNCMLLNFFPISSSEWSIRRCLHSFASFRFERNCSCKEPPTYYVINKIGSSHVLLHRCHLGKESQLVSELVTKVDNYQTQGF